MTRADFADVRLGDLLSCDPFTGVRQDSDGGEQIAYVTSALVAAKEVIEQLPSDQTRRAPKGRWASFGDVLLQCRGIERRTQVPGAIVKLDADLAFAESLILVRVDPTLADPDYIRLYLASETAGAALAAAATGTTSTYLRPEALIGLRMRLPSLETQHEIAGKMHDMQAHLASIEATAETFRDLISAAREGLLTGALRVGATEAGPDPRRTGEHRRPAPRVPHR